MADEAIDNNNNNTGSSRSRGSPAPTSTSSSSSEEEEQPKSWVEVGGGSESEEDEEHKEGSKPVIGLPEPKVDWMSERGILLREVIAKERELYRPSYVPFQVSVKGLTYTVKVPPPQDDEKPEGLGERVMGCLPWCCNKKKRKVKKNIIQDVSFQLKPGQMTLLLGTPGCGKSTLFKILSHRTRGGKIKGDIRFNREEPRKKYYHRDIAYITQEDEHMPAMTVKETLMFSARCTMPKSVPRKMAKHRANTFLQLLGLTHRANTIVGNELLRGISGGEKKRVTIGIECMKDPALWLMDEPTTGLDASAAYEVMRAMRTICDMGAPVFASLLQPSYELFCLFDNVMLMSKGEIAWLGPREEATKYFYGLGRYRCLENLNPAEFLAEITESSATKHLNSYKFRDEDDEGEWHSREEFIDAYHSSKYYQAVEEGVAVDIVEDEEVDEEKVDNRSEEERETQEKMKVYDKEPQYSANLVYQFWLLLVRSIMAERRAPQTFISQVVGIIMEALIIGTLFLQIGHSQTDARLRMGLIFFSIGHFTFLSLTALPQILKERTVYYMQRAGKYYKALPYLIAVILAEIPLALVETVLFSCIAYWMTGLTDIEGGSRFWIFMCIIFSNAMCMNAFSRMIASVTPAPETAMGVAPGGIAIAILLSGYIIPRNSIPGWWIWLYWANPLRYAYEAIANNEFRGTTYHCGAGDLVPPKTDPAFNLTYPAGFQGNQACPITEGTNFISHSFDLFEPGWIIAIDIAAIWGFWFLFSMVTYLGISFFHFTGKRPPPPKQDTFKSYAETGPVSRGGKDGFSSTLSSLVLPAKPVYMEWSHLEYTVKAKRCGKNKKLKLLHDVSGYVKPGMLLALMGASGAGKSTLLDVLAHRKTGGTIKGKIRVNGRTKGFNLKRLIGYVEQQDLHLPLATVRETLEFSALCRLSKSVPRKEKIAYAHRLIGILGLESVEDSIVGTNSLNGISNDQRKRLTIGVEMAANPSLLFLDEPTSGLDSLGAERVMYAVQRAAQAGKSVICTIHQPSATVFGMFTHLILLKKGGHTVYFGPIGEKVGDFTYVLDYFAKLGFTCPPHKNPADFILEHSGAGLSKGSGEADKEGEEKSDEEEQDEEEEEKEQEEKEMEEVYGKETEDAENFDFVAAFKESDQHKTLMEDLEGGIFNQSKLRNVPETRKKEEKEKNGDNENENEEEEAEAEEEEEEESGSDTSKREQLQKKVFKSIATWWHNWRHRYATPSYLQLWYLFVRRLKAYWRDTGTVVMKFVRALFIGFLLGTLFLQLNNDQRGAGNRVALVYFGLLFTLLGSLEGVPMVLSERAVFYREKASATYRSWVYSLTFILADIPFVFFTTIAFVIPFYFIPGLQYEADKFFIFLATYTLCTFAAISAGQMIGVVSPNLTLANALLGIVLSSFSLLSGFVLTKDQIPDWWIWGYYLSFLTYPLEAAVANELKGLDLYCGSGEATQVHIAGTNFTKGYCPFTTGEQFLSSFDLNPDNIGRDIGILAGFYAVLVLITALAFSFVNHQKR